MTERPPSARAFWVTAPGRGELRSESLPPRNATGEVLVKALASGISRGSETIVFQGRVPQAEAETMRCPFQEGAFPAPVKYGYSAVGMVVQGEGAGATLEGRRVFCLFPHQDWYVVPASAVLPIPDDVPTERAVLAANMETAINALWDAAPRIGDRIAVVGAGIVGGLTAALARHVPATTIELIDSDTRRAVLAEALGIPFAQPADARGDADIVLHASGQAAGMRTALDIAGFEATVVDLSWYGDADVTLPLGAVHSRRLRIIGSQVGQVAPARRARRSRRERLALALSLLADPIFDVFLTGASDFTELPETMARLAAAPDGALCHLVRYE